MCVAGWCYDLLHYDGARRAWLDQMAQYVNAGQT
jgi:hypothetical protein